MALTFLDSSDNHPQQGMTPDDMRTIERVAAMRNEVIMFRDTGCWSRPYIAAGHPTKPFHIKGKSSDWGPMAGLIPWNSEYSKAWAEKDIKKGIEANKHTINSGKFAKTVPLRISEQHFTTNLLRRQGPLNKPPIDRWTEPRAGVRYYFCEKPNDDPSKPGKKYVLFGRKIDGGLWEIYTFGKDSGTLPERELFLKETNAERIDVMASYHAGKPITGDYDLFAICPSWNAFGALDRKMDPTLDDRQYEASRNRTLQKAMNVPNRGEENIHARAIASLKAVDDAVSKEHEHLGNLTGRVEQVIKALQNAMPGGPDLWRVHHNAESGRPFAPGAADGMPVTTFHPRRGIGGLNFINATIENAHDLREYFETLYTHGYYPPRNRSWDMRNIIPAERTRAVEAMLRKRLGR